MSHYRNYAVLAGACALLAVAGCGGGGGSGGSATAPTTPTPTTPTPAANPELTPFVKQLVATTTETADPGLIDTITFGTADDTNETAYNDILPP